MESQTRRVEEWLKKTVVPAEGGREDSLSWLPFLRFIQLEKVTMGCGDDNGFRRTDIWNRTSVGGVYADSSRKSKRRQNCRIRHDGQRQL